MRLGLATEGTITLLRRQRATAIPSRPVTAPAEQTSSYVQVQGLQQRFQIPSRLVHAPAGRVAAWLQGCRVISRGSDSD